MGWGNRPAEYYRGVSKLQNIMSFYRRTPVRCDRVAPGRHDRRIPGPNADVFSRRATSRRNTMIFILCQYNRSQSAPSTSNERLLLRKSRKCRKKKACSENTSHQQYTGHGGTMGPDSSTTKNRCDFRTGSIERL